MSAERISSHRYSAGALIGDYGRVGVGLLFTLGPLAATTPLPAITGVLGAFAALFLAYGARTVIRHCTVIDLSAKGMEARGPLGARLDWDEVRGLSVRYFSTRRDRTGGWLQLKVRGRRLAVRIDSTIGDFDALLEHATRAARLKGIKLDQSSIENLRLSGIRLGLDDGPAGRS